jgi:hypothetical protein
MSEPEVNPRQWDGNWPEPEDDSDRKLLEDVRTVGWHLIGIEADEEGPAFVYSIGLTATYGHPELIMFGLPVETLFQVLNTLGGAIHAGARFGDGEETDQALDGYSLLFRQVELCHFREYLGYARWFYRGDRFDALQCVWPDSKGRYPSQPDFEPRLSALQPALWSAA